MTPEQRRAVGDAIERYRVSLYDDGETVDVGGWAAGTTDSDLASLLVAVLDLAADQTVTTTELHRLLGRQVSAHGLTEQQLRQAVQTVRDRRGRQPTREDVAAELGVSESTVKRAMKVLRLGKWPPPVPDN